MFLVVTETKFILFLLEQICGGPDDCCVMFQYLLSRGKKEDGNSRVVSAWRMSAKQLTLRTMYSDEQKRFQNILNRSLNLSLTYTNKQHNNTNGYNNNNN